MVVIVERALRAAEDDEAVIAGMALRDGLAEMRRRRSICRAGFAERLPDEAERRGGEILDDKNAHGSFPGSLSLGASLADLVA